MRRKVLLLEPNYKNKYPPMGLMKLATYFRGRGDSVRFYKGNLKKLIVDLLRDEFLNEIQNLPNWDILAGKQVKMISEYLKTGKQSLLDEIDSILSNEWALSKLQLFRRRYRTEDYPKFDFICVTTLFTFYWKETIETINFAKKLCDSTDKIMVGGIAASILPEHIYEETGIYPHVGLLNNPGNLDTDDDRIIDNLPLDYSILEEIEYNYPANDAYFAYMTRGCPRNCDFCAVPKLEPDYCGYIGLKTQLAEADARFGKKKNLLLMDNNVFASKNFEKIIEEIKDCGFQKGATYIPSNEYNISIQNLKESFNTNAFINKIITLYDLLSEKLPEEKQAEFYLEREKKGLLYVGTATKEAILEFDNEVHPLYSKYYKRGKQVRYIDFNQGIDARLVTEKKMEKLAEINIRPLRIAFDHYSMKDTYVKAIQLAAKFGIKSLSNYLLYNFEDRPDELYKRLQINVDLCEKEKVTIYSFPMKYHPIAEPAFFRNRDYIGEHWNRKFIRAIQAVLNATKGKIGRGRSFFEEAFGRDVDEFMKIIWMPEEFIIYRRKYDKDLRQRLIDKYECNVNDENDLANDWWHDFSNLDKEEQAVAKSIISNNRFYDETCSTENIKVNKVLSYYRKE